MIFEELLDIFGPEIRKKQLVALGFGGEYAAGKTTFTKNFADFLILLGYDAQALPTDMYFRYSKPERHKLLSQFKEEGTYEQKLPETYELRDDLILEHLDKLRNGQEVTTEGLYQRDTGDLDFKLHVHFNGQPKWLLYDGVWVVSEPFKSIMDKIVVITSETPERMQRAKLRAANLDKPYVQTPEKFYGVDGFTKKILEQNLSDSFIHIDNTNFTQPKIYK